jgi:hypothetical protein
MEMSRRGALVSIAASSYSLGCATSGRHTREPSSWIELSYDDAAFVTNFDQEQAVMAFRETVPWYRVFRDVALPGVDVGKYVIVELAEGTMPARRAYSVGNLTVDSSARRPTLSLTLARIMVQAKVTTAFMSPTTVWLASGLDFYLAACRPIAGSTTPFLLRGLPHPTIQPLIRGRQPFRVADLWSGQPYSPRLEGVYRGSTWGLVHLLAHRYAQQFSDLRAALYARADLNSTVQRLGLNATALDRELAGYADSVDEDSGVRVPVPRAPRPDARLLAEPEVARWRVKLGG